MTYAEFVAIYSNRLESYIRRFAKRFRIYGAAVDDLRQEAHLAAFRALPYWRDILRRNNEESSRVKLPTGQVGTSGNNANRSQGSPIRPGGGIGAIKRGAGRRGREFRIDGRNAGCRAGRGFDSESGDSDQYDVSEYGRGKSAFNWCAGPMRRAMEKSVRREFGQRPFAVEPICDNREPFNEHSFVGLNKSNLGVFGPSSTSIESTLDLARALKNDKKPSAVMRFIISTISPASGADLARQHGISRQAICMSNRKTRERLLQAMG